MFDEMLEELRIVGLVDLTTPPSCSRKLTREGPFSNAFPAFMFSSFKKLKALSFTAALVFLLATSFLSAHSHAANQGDKDHSCSICHVSHAHQKTLVGSSPLKIENSRLVQRTVVLHFVAFSSDTLSASLIRGPPVLS